MTVVGPWLLVEPVLDVVVHTGKFAVSAQAPLLAELADSVPGTPVTARWPWQSVSVLDPAEGQTPWMVGVMSGERLVAAAVLLDDVTGSVRRTTLAGTEDGHRGALLATTEPAAALLGSALAERLMTELREFTLGPIRSDAAVRALFQRLPVGVVVDEANIPVIRDAPELGSGMTHGTARTLRKAQNRMATDLIDSEIRVTDDRHVITGMLPLLAAISRDRDVASGRESPLDDLPTRRRWERRVRALATDGSLRLATHLLDGELAAYLFGIVDGPAYRVLEGRYVGAYSRYAPGRVLEAAVAAEVLASPEFELLDWMTTVAPETLLAANDVDPHLLIRGRT
jgi:hypothetical protein